MSTTTLTRARSQAPVLDFNLLARGFLYFFFVCIIVAPFTPDPIPMIGGAIVPYMVLRIVNTPTMPVAVVYLFLWQWMQIFTRVLQGWVDGEALAKGLYGPNVERAYWYMLGGIIVLALCFRLVLGNLRPATVQERTAHLAWQRNDLLLLYIGALIASTVFAGAAQAVSGLAQPLGAVSQLKVVAIFILFTTVMSTGRGHNMLLGVILFEIAVGFTGFLSDFRSVFIFLGISALAARIRWTWTMGITGLAAAGALIALALFWTSVKQDYRVYVAQSDESQAIKVPLGERMAYLGEKFLSPGAIDLKSTSYMLLNRLAYVDIFGSVIDIQEAAPEPIPMRQWVEAMSHVTMPRFLFPGKPPLLDSEVYMRLARRFSTEGEVRAGTSISVGYMAENFADLGVPGMFVGIAVMGLLLAGSVRILMNFKLPMIMRQGLVMAFCFMMSRDGVEVSLPKILGAMTMFMIMFLIMNKFLFPRVVKLLDDRGAAARLKTL